MEAKIRFSSLFFRCYFAMRFCIDFGVTFGGSKPEKHQISLGKTRIFAKSRFSKKLLNHVDFGSIFGGQNTKISLKIVSKKVLFLSMEF